VCRETLRTGGKILTDIVENKSTAVSAGDIAPKHVTESKQLLVNKLRALGRKRVRETGLVVASLKESVPE